MLNVAEYPLILEKSSYGLVGYVSANIPGVFAE